MKILAALATFVFLAWLIVASFLSIDLDRNCLGYLERAANANTVELAEMNLKKAIAELERRGLTDGFTSILYRSPDEDISYWYGNLVASENELEALPADSSQLERSNVLMKLRETLLQHNKDGEDLVRPEGMSRYPSNTAFAVWGWGSLLLSLALWGCVLVESDLW